MFRSLANASLRRSLHTSSRPVSAATRPARFRTALAASAVAASYFAWNTWYGERIALDSAKPPSKQVPLTPKSSASPEAISHSDSTAPEHEPSLHPDSPPESPQADETKADPAAEGEAEQESGGEGGGGGAFNPETGEINWDCPCLGGMAHGPCGMQFREAFSCFVFSEADPKGIDCVEKFKAMQECFREHPDVYGDDIMNEDDEEEGEFALDAPPASDAPSQPETEKQPIPASPSESGESTPAPTEKKSKPKKAPAPSSH